ncbi:hypothetical protein [Streptomyces sp. PanSC19]|uniref:hypothetical protein n=1 Tax=Streptomyces sp. PanSC19 TaxID=1520455 RepID=UPI0037DA44E8
MNLHKAGVATTVKGEKSVTVFNDHTNKYWDESNKYSRVIVPDIHTRIEVLWNSLNKLETLVHVKPVK